MLRGGDGGDFGAGVKKRISDDGQRRAAKTCATEEGIGVFTDGTDDGRMSFGS